MKRQTLLLVLALFLTGSVNVMGQGFLGTLGKKAAERVKQKVTEKVEKTVDGATDRILNGNQGKEDKNDEINEDAPTAKPQGPNKNTPTPQGEDVKSDFVRGDVVIFQDNLQGEQMGEFPSKWDLLENNAEVAKMNGKMAIKFEHGSDTEITPLIEDGNKKYLPEVYSLEFDFFVTGEEDLTSTYTFTLHHEDDGSYGTITFGRDGIDWYLRRPTGDDMLVGSTSLTNYVKQNDWNHFAVSFNKRALKAYINNRRVTNIPNAKAADWFSVRTQFWEDHIDYITNITLAKGGGQLYERQASDLSPIEKAIAETGKFVTNNILFETGKATLKAESMEEIQKVADYMKKNPSVRFEVQGHTDNQGSDKINDPLSQQRAEAVVKALAELGVDEFNLRAVGKGSKEPVADNGTEEGRAKNRRVVFVKK